MRSLTSRKQTGLTLPETLCLLAGIGFLYTLVVPSNSCSPVSGKRTRCQSDLTLTSMAIKYFYVEYGSYPLCKNVEDDLVVSGDRQRDLFNILRNQEVSGSVIENHNGIVFLEGREQKGPNPKGGFGEDKAFYDPWGNRYSFVIDANQDGKVTVPMEWHTRDSGKTISQPVIGFSPGKKINDAADDVTTW